MKIITYNVNGLRAAVNKGLPEWLAEENPDVLCLQETKLQPEQYPAEAFEALGYKAYLYSAQKKGYSGVAILTKVEPDHIEYGMGIEEYDNEGRFIRADFGDLSVVSVYHPSGTSGDERQAFKMVWLEAFQKYVTELRKSRPNLILCGDYNICHEPIDIQTPIIMRTNKPLLLLAIILMIPSIILVLKVEPTDGEMFTAIVFGILSAVVSYLSRD